MRFLVDECTGPSVAEWLRNQKHEVFSVFEEARGMDDDDIILKALEENWILITNDKDFGELIFRLNKPSSGTVLLRLRIDSPKNRIKYIYNLIKNYSDKLKSSFIVLSEGQIRIRKL